jgi:hypothetical protein
MKMIEIFSDTIGATVVATKGAQKIMQKENATQVRRLWKS